MVKRRVLLSLVLLPLLLLWGCGSNQEIIYTDDLPFQIDMSGDDISILQITDLHLLYGIDDYDRKTLRGIETLVSRNPYDLVVISGDLVMSTSAPSLFGKLIKFMDGLDVPWTFVFGNHETDYQDYPVFLNQLTGLDNLLFKVGPQMEYGGVGNFRIQFMKEDAVFYTLYLMDSHTEEAVYTEEEGIYGYFSDAQVSWYEEHVQDDVSDSVMIMHIPLREYMNPVDYDGVFLEDKVYAQGKNTGMFDKIVEYGKTKGVFVGHDHLNNFSFVKDGVLLAYGQITGYNAYGYLNRGGRVIHIDDLGLMTSFIVYIDEEVSS